MERRQWTGDRGRKIGDRGQGTGDRGRSNFEFQSSNFPHGVTLMEVLISIAVVAIGLLGVLSLIPIGTFAVIETNKSDRSAALGRAAMHEVRVRGMLEPRNEAGNSRWYFARSGEAAITGVWKYNSPFLIGQAFAIDPLFATEAASRGILSSNIEYNRFPYAISSSLSFYEDYRLPRIRLDMFDTIYGMSSYVAGDDTSKILISQKQLAVFNRVFTWPDDLIFDIDQDNPDLRPRQSFYWSAGATAPYPIRTGESVAGDPLGAQSVGDYTWMLTVEPDISELPITSDITVLQNFKQNTYAVSVVTFYKRNFTCDSSDQVPSERFVEIDFSSSTGIGGGDAVLKAPLQDAQGGPMTKEIAEEYLKVKQGEWIMVSAFIADTRLNAIEVFYGYSPYYRRIAKWYKVIRVDDEVQQDLGNFSRNVTLDGPNWDITTPPTVVTDSERATIIEGAIGVYTTTVTLE